MFFIALTVATLLSMIAFMRNIGVLGVAFAKSVYYPSFATVRISSIGEFFARIESIVSSNYLFGGVVNIALCLFTVSKGTARLFSFGNYRQVVLPICLLCLALSLVIYKDAMQLFYFIEQYQFYVIPFQFLIPILTWIFAEIKTRKAKKISAGSAG